MTRNCPPSQDPADIGTLTGALRFAFSKMMQSTDGMLPCKFVSVTADRNFATVQPLIQVLDTLGGLTSRDQVAKVPIFTIGGGGIVLSFPIKAGDLGWIIASDRDISLFLQANGEAGPNTNRLHSFEDGLVIPDIARQWVLAGEDADNAVLQIHDGTAKIALGAAKVKVLHPTLVEFDTPSVTMSEAVTAGKGVGAYGVTAPGAQPAVTGALSMVTDANAKAVLTSIIAVFVGNGDASDGTT